MCNRRRYQEQGQVITPPKYCGIQLFVPDLDYDTRVFTISSSFCLCRHIRGIKCIADVVGKQWHTNRNIYISPNNQWNYQTFLVVWHTVCARRDPVIFIQQLLKYRRSANRHTPNAYAYDRGYGHCTTTDLRPFKIFEGTHSRELHSHGNSHN